MRPAFAMDPTCFNGPTNPLNFTTAGGCPKADVTPKIMLKRRFSQTAD
jgi:hypothetical protein